MIMWIVSVDAYGTLELGSLKNGGHGDAALHVTGARRRGICLKHGLECRRMS